MVKRGEFHWKNLFLFQFQKFLFEFLKIESKRCTPSSCSLFIKIFAINMKSVHRNNNAVQDFLMQQLGYRRLSSTRYSTNSYQIELILLNFIDNLINHQILFFFLLHDYSNLPDIEVIKQFKSLKQSQLVVVQETQQNTFSMSISLSTFSSVVIDFVGEVLVPVLDKNNVNFAVCILKWEEFKQTVMRKISNYKTEDDLRQKVKMICKMQRQEKSQKQFEIKPQLQSVNRYSQSRVSQDERSIKRAQQYGNKHVEWQNQGFKDRKLSTDESHDRRQRREQSQIIMRRQDRSNSFNGNSLQSEIVVEVPSIFVQGVNEKQKNSYQKKDNDILSFNSISEFHKSRNNISLALKQSDKSEGPVQQPQVNPLPKKAIEDNNFAPTSSQVRPNSYSTNYIDSIKKINIESRSPNSKSKPKPYYAEVQSSQDHVETTPLRVKESEVLRRSNMESMKKRISDGADYLTSPRIGPESFSKFLTNFKKLCTTFESNHQKLLRQDFNNKYVNC